MRSGRQSRTARSMSEAVSEIDVDRLLIKANNPAALQDSATLAASPTDFASRLDLETASFQPGSALDPARNTVSIWDIPVFILYACLGVFARIWTDVTLFFDFSEDSNFQAFAIAVSFALHGFIIAIVFSAWRGNWRFKNRNLLAIATLGGYLGFRMLTNL